MDRLVINTKKSVFKPITIEIDGKVFHVRRIDEGSLKKLYELDKACAEGVNPKAPYDRLRFLLNTTDGMVAKCDLGEVNAITTYITTRLYKPEKIGTDSEKN